jgi:hypothetical protein
MSARPSEACSCQGHSSDASLSGWTPDSKCPVHTRVTTPPSEDKNDPRFTMGLYLDVIRVLEKHGYVRAPGNAPGAGVLVELLHMVREFEGRVKS